GHSLTGHTQTLASVYTSGEGDHHLAPFLDHPTPAAGLARIRHDAAPATTTVASGAEHDEAALGGHLATAATGNARLRLGTCSCSRATAVVTRSGALNDHLLLGTFHGVFECDRSLDSHVSSAFAATALSATTEAATSSAEKVGEHVLEVVEDIPHSGSREIEAIAPESRVTEAIVGRPLFSVGQHTVRFSGFFKAHFRSSIALVAVGMVLQGELAIGAADVVLACLSAHLQYFVIVAL